MKLEAVHLIQFFAYERFTLSPGESTGIFGANGSGKSSFLDAVQIAMFGANSNLTALNAQADESTKSSRSIRGYCLGQFGENPEDRIRQRANTYITLVWRDPSSNRPVSMGVAIEASGDSEQHNVLGRYLADGVELTLGDHMTSREGKESPRDWRTFRADLARRVESVCGHTEDLFFDSSEKFIKAFLLLMSAGKDAGSVALFKRAFRFAMRLRFDKSVDSIIRDEVLESRPTNIKAFRELTETFRRLRVMVEDVERRMREGAEIEKLFIEADKLERRAGAWRVLAADVHAEHELDEANAAQSKAADDAENHALAEEHKRVAELEVARLEADDRSLKQQRDSHKAHEALAHLPGQIEKLNRDAESADKEALEKLAQLCSVLSHAAAQPLLEQEAPRLRAAAQDVEAAGLDLERLRGGVLARAIKVAREAHSQVLKAWSNQNAVVSDLEQALAGAKENLERARQGKAPLPPGVASLMRHLADHGVNSTPVCDLVRVTEERWQPAIEGLLSDANLTALLVDERDEKQAFSLYRALVGRGAIYGVKLVRPSQIRLDRSPQIGSVAELVAGEDAVAVAFIRKLLGTIRQAETDDEALAGGRALTPDGMLVGDATIERIRPAPRHMLRLGIKPAAHQEFIDAEIKRLQHEKIASEKRLNDLKALSDVLSFIPSEQVLTKDLTASLERARENRRDAEVKRLSLEEQSDEDYVLLCRKIEDINSTTREMRKKLLEATAKEASLKTLSEQSSQAAEKSAKAATEAKEQAEEIRAATSFDQDFAADQWDKLVERFANDWTGAEQHCRAQRKNRLDDCDATSRSGTSKLQHFCMQHRETPGGAVLENWRLSHEWIADLVRRLRDTELKEYKDKMLEAERASQETFRTDVAVRLSENIGWLDAQINRLNNVLDRSPAFSNAERYRFKRHVRPELSGLLKFIQDIATFGPGEDLFGGAGEIPPQFAELLDEKTALGTGNARSPLDDYREFYVFDIEILRDDPEGGRPKVIGHLSKRIGPGSGGEHRAPLYVIAGAALASAYNLENSRGGMSLILFDEAFDKMDASNTVATMRYLEELGLQILFASPGHNKALLAAFTDVYYSIQRNPINNALLIDRRLVSEKVRDLMRSDLPQFHPEIVEAEIQAVRESGLTHIQTA